jgi:hypothetical protein
MKSAGKDPLMTMAQLTDFLKRNGELTGKWELSQGVYQMQRGKLDGINLWIYVMPTDDCSFETTVETKEVKTTKVVGMCAEVVTNLNDRI